MDKLNINELEEIAPHVRKHLVPEIEQAVEVCIQCYNFDELNNDMWTFGTQLWRNTWNRFKNISEEYEDCPFNVCGKGNEYKLKIGPFIIRHHRIDYESRLPNGANAIKKRIEEQMKLFSDELEAPVEIDNIVLAIDADVQNGLKEVFVGELKKKNPETNQYEWGKKVPVYLADDLKTGQAESIQISNNPGFKYAPEEEIPEVAVGLDKSKTNEKIIGSDTVK